MDAPSFFLLYMLGIGPAFCQQIGNYRTGLHDAAGYDLRSGAFPAKCGDQAADKQRHSQPQFTGSELPDDGSIPYPIGRS